jgi:uncharacterized RDD family membrane protein YckC
MDTSGAIHTPFSEEDLPSITRRYLAVFVDGMLVFTAFMILSAVFEGHGGIAAVRVAAIVGFIGLYEPLCTSRLCTVGQSLLGVRVRTLETGKRISIFQAYVRLVIKVLLGWISFFSILFSRERRGLHDIGCGSIVITSRALARYSGDGGRWPGLVGKKPRQPPGVDAGMPIRQCTANVCVVCHKGIGPFAGHQGVTFVRDGVRYEGNVHQDCLSAFQRAVRDGDGVALRSLGDDAGCAEQQRQDLE